MLVAAYARSAGSSTMNDNFETRKIPHPPSHDAIDHIIRAIDCVVAWHNDPYFVPTRTDISRLDGVCAAFGYASAIANYVKSELDNRLVDESDEVRSFRQRYKR
jgi:hypothetical protein